MWLKVGLFSESFPPVIDGVSNVVLNYAKIIQQNHGQSVVAVPKEKDAVDDYPFQVIRYDSVAAQKKISYRVGNPFDPKTLKKLRRQRLDIIHIHSPFASSILAGIVAGKKKIPVVVTYHTKFDVDFEERLNSTFMKRVAINFVLSNIRAADEVWAVSKGAALALKQIGFEGECLVMENGTDFARGLSPQEELDCLFTGRYGVQKEELVIVYVGRMMWYKNPRLILDTLALAKRRGLRFRMFFVGGGYELGDIKSYAEQAGVAQECIFTGAISDREELRKYYSRADLFFFPSTFDTSGIVVKEAAACNCPALLIRGSCAAEDVEDGVNGFLADENAESLCERLCAAVADREALGRVGEAAGRDLYLSWEDAVAKAYQRYEVLVARWRQQPRRRIPFLKPPRRKD